MQTKINVFRCLLKGFFLNNISHDAVTTERLHFPPAFNKVWRLSHQHEARTPERKPETVGSK